jgi:hypothetical protein
VNREDLSLTEPSGVDTRGLWRCETIARPAMQSRISGSDEKRGGFPPPQFKVLPGRPLLIEAVDERQVERVIRVLQARKRV